MTELIAGTSSTAIRELCERAQFLATASDEVKCRRVEHTVRGETRRPPVGVASVNGVRLCCVEVLDTRTAARCSRLSSLNAQHARDGLVQ
ncbi:hypothetical protein ABH924_001736 [Arthrobacter sp. GAS37]